MSGWGPAPQPGLPGASPPGAGHPVVGWGEPAAGAGELPGGEWSLPAPAADRTVLRTGPSGVVLGTAPGADAHPPGEEPDRLTVRLFRPRPSRFFLAAGGYVTWLLAYRSLALGAHLSVLTERPARWDRLRRAVLDSGGSIDLLAADQAPPGSGRPYRPSLLVDDVGRHEGGQRLGPWQSVLVEDSAAASGAVFALRACDLALVGPCDARVTENLRRAYVLGPGQVRDCAGLAADELVLAMPRRLVRVRVRPTPTEHELLFRP